MGRFLFVLLLASALLLSSCATAVTEEKEEITEPLPAPAAFLVSNLSVQPLEVESRESVTITVSVDNTGETEGSFTVVLTINGIKEAEKSVTIAGGNTKDVTFTVTKEEAESYSIVIDGLTTSFTVVAPVKIVTPTPKPPSPVTPTVVIPNTTAQVTEDVEYGRAGNIALLLDVYIPETPIATPMPAIVYIHGGSWRIGDKAISNPLRSYPTYLAHVAV